MNWVFWFETKGLLVSGVTGGGFAAVHCVVRAYAFGDGGLDGPFDGRYSRVLRCSISYELSMSLIQFLDGALGGATCVG